MHQRPKDDEVMKLLSLEHQGRKDKDTKDLLEQSWMKRDLSHVRENVAAGSHTAAQKLVRRWLTRTNSKGREMSCWAGFEETAAAVGSDSVGDPPAAAGQAACELRVFR